jgi:hypothetical protein
MLQAGDLWDVPSILHQWADGPPHPRSHKTALATLFYAARYDPVDADSFMLRFNFNIYDPCSKS